MVFFFPRDEKAAIKIEKVGWYTPFGVEKVEIDDSKYSRPRYRVTVEYEFGPSGQMDGHEPADGDMPKCFAEVVYNCFKEAVNEKDFIEIMKAVGCYNWS